jgi:hypothetical protein
MKLLPNLRSALGVAASLAAAVAATPSSFAAPSSCPICDKEVVINSDLAVCFLDQYKVFAASTDASVLIDLTECGESRGIIPGIPGVQTSEEKPTMRFRLSRVQMDCLKQKLELPGLELDPSVRIDLSACG